MITVINAYNFGGLLKNFVNYELTDEYSQLTCGGENPPMTLDEYKWNWMYRNSPFGGREQKRLYHSPHGDSCDFSHLWTYNITGQGGALMARFEGRQTADTLCGSETGRRVYMYPVFYSGNGFMFTYMDSTKRFRINDNLGNMRSEIRFHTYDSTVMINSFDYKPFGDSLKATKGLEEHSFGDGERESENDYILLGVRLYDPELGRFTSVDPLFETMREQTPYQYAYNSPMIWKDPTGLKPEKEKRDRVLQMKFDEDVVTPHELPDLHGDVRALLYDAIDFSNLAAAIFDLNQASLQFAGLFGGGGSSASKPFKIGFGIGDRGGYYGIDPDGNRMNKSVGEVQSMANNAMNRLAMLKNKFQDIKKQIEDKIAPMINPIDAKIYKYNIDEDIYYSQFAYLSVEGIGFHGSYHVHLQFFLNEETNVLEITGRGITTANEFGNANFWGSVELFVDGEKIGRYSFYKPTSLSFSRSGYFGTASVPLPDFGFNVILSFRFGYTFYDGFNNAIPWPTNFRRDYKIPIIPAPIINYGPQNIYP